MKPADLTNDALNAAIAREVMGWTEWETYAAFCAGPFPAFYVQADGIIHAWYSGDAGDVYAWSPATYIAAAFEVVEKVKRDGVVTIYVGEPTAEETTVTIRTDPAAPGWVIRGKGIAQTTPRAICEAALAALRSKS